MWNGSSPDPLHPSPTLPLSLPHQIYTSLKPIAAWCLPMPNIDRIFSAGLSLIRIGTSVMMVNCFFHKPRIRGTKKPLKMEWLFIALSDYISLWYFSLLIWQTLLNVFLKLLKYFFGVHVVGYLATREMLWFWAWNRHKTQNLMQIYSTWNMIIIYMWSL